MRSDTDTDSDTATDFTSSIVDICRQVLGLDEIDADTDFFDAGGNSILAARVVARVRDATGTVVSMRDMLFSRTPRALAARVAELAANGRG